MTVDSESPMKLWSVNLREMSLLLASTYSCMVLSGAGSIMAIIVHGTGDHNGLLSVMGARKQTAKPGGIGG